MKVVRADEMYRYEQKIMQEKQVPALVLMEEAARAVVKQMKRTITQQDRMLIVASGGNNGADGIAVGRILHNEGFAVTIFLTAAKKVSRENQRQQNIARAYGVPIVTEWQLLELNDYSVVVDGLFGIGLSRTLSGEVLEIIEQINRAQNIVYAIDLPSGISAQDGTVLGTAVEADETITFGFYKYGMEEPALQKYFGEITVDDIGFFY